MSTTLKSEAQIAKFRKLIVTVSIVIPIAVAALFGIDIDGDLDFLPPFYAGINALTAILLICALLAIKNKNVKLHQRLIQICLFLSVVFLVCYVAYHMTSGSTRYEGEAKPIYYFILFSHITLSIAVIPIVLFTYLFAWEGKFQFGFMLP
jgi:putative membrane protein